MFICEKTGEFTDFDAFERGSICSCSRCQLAKKYIDLFNAAPSFAPEDYEDITSMALDQHRSLNSESRPTPTVP